MLVFSYFVLCRFLALLLLHRLFVLCWCMGVYEDVHGALLSRRVWLASASAIRGDVDRERNVGSKKL